MERRHDSMQQLQQVTDCYLIISHRHPLQQQRPQALHSHMQDQISLICSIYLLPVAGDTPNHEQRVRLQVMRRFP